MVRLLQAIAGRLTAEGASWDLASVGSLKGIKVASYYSGYEVDPAVDEPYFPTVGEIF
jgi:hypothetical protein